MKPCVGVFIIDHKWVVLQSHDGIRLSKWPQQVNEYLDLLAHERGDILGWASMKIGQR